MKRWVVVLLVSLAVVVLVSPGLVGRLAEQNLNESMDWVERENADLSITEESFDRRWFTAEGRHRIELRGDLRARVASLTGRRQDDAVPALILDTRIDHGLVPLTSIGREAGSLAPGLASAVSTMQLDLGNGELITIPGTLYSQVGLTGTTVTRYLLPEGSFDDEGMNLRWQGADVSFTTSASRREVEYFGVVQPALLETEDTRIEFGKAVFEGSGSDSGYGFMVGDLEFDMDSLSVIGETGDEVDIGKLVFNGSSEVADERVSARSKLAVSDLAVPGYGDVAVAMEVAASRLDARSLQGILAELEHAQRQGDPDAALAAIWPRVQDDLQNLLTAGAELSLDRFDVTLPQGQVMTRLSFSLPETEDDEGFSWAALLLALSASADVSVPVAVMEVAQAANPQAGTLVAMGFLKKEGDAYVVDARYEKGLVTVNGAPMPIPLPAK